MTKGKRVTIIDGLKDEYYRNGIPTNKLVIPNKIEDSDCVDIEFTNSSQYGNIGGMSIIIYLNDYGTFDLYSYNSLRYVKLPNKEWDLSCLRYTTELEQIKIDADNLYYTLEDGVLFSKDKTAVIKYPAKKQLSNYTLPNTVLYINDYTFYECTNLETINMPNSVTYIGRDAFSGCTSLKEVDIPEGVTVINPYVFSGCSSLTTIDIPEGVTNIDMYAFNRCTGLTTINIPDSVTSIGSGAFYECSGLTTINIPKGVTKIEMGLFSGCNNLTELRIPNTVTEIYSHNRFLNDQPFYNCTNLTITVEADSPLTINDFEYTGIDQNKVIFE